MQLFAPQIFNPFTQNQSSLINCPQPVMPANLTKPPNQWSKEEVGAWLAWCAEEFSIDSVSPERFNMNGRAVCLLNRDDFMQRSPEAGDVLYNALQMLIKRQLPMPALKPRNNGFNSPTPLQTTIQSQPFMLMAGNQKISHTAATNSPSGPFLTPPLTSPVTTVPPLQQIDYNINKTLNNTPSKSLFFCFIF
ncbi:ETV6_7 [Acanthosepion pharaonis]|uniref:ETV6_7 n=1 Tax=Acanthosepion pharaonis TaxID=158019 RepID=A0A812BUQ7_ACAPH|nr:ETV6_7 [Sepia pharaonis]